MTLVIDASVALAVVIPDEQSAWAEEVVSVVARMGARAPMLWELEVVSGLRSAELRGRISAGDADAAYLAVAVRHAVPLASHDRALVAAAQAEGIDTPSAC